MNAYETHSWQLFCLSYFDSASQKLVTARQMFSADPAPGKPGRLSGTSAVSPFALRGVLALRSGTDESRASIITYYSIVM